MQIYFMFVTRKGQIITAPVEMPENTVEINVDASNVSSLCTRNSVAFLGNEEGHVVKVDLNSKKVVGKYDSLSKLPIFNIKIAG